MAGKKRRSGQSRRPQRGHGSKRSKQGFVEPRALPRDGAAFFGAETVEGPSWDFGRPYILRRVGAAGAQKNYVCPGCNNTIFAGMAHIVAWPQEGGGRVEERRHWHTRCWERR